MEIWNKLDPAVALCCSQVERKFPCLGGPLHLLTGKYAGGKVTQYMVTQRACTAMKISSVRIFEMCERLKIVFVSSLKLCCSTEVFCGEAYLMQDGHCHGALAGAYGYSTLSAQVPKLCSLFIHLGTWICLIFMLVALFIALYLPSLA